MLGWSLLALALALAPTVHADSLGGQIQEVGDTLVSAMMMFVGGTTKVYILDKVEGNAQQINGHPAYASVWDLASKTATLMDVQTNPFCAAGMHVPNGSFAVFGGNQGIGPGGDNHLAGSTAAFDPTYQDFDGRRSIRVITPCDGDVDSDPSCEWYDQPNGLQMQSGRWYPAAEALGNGSVILIGGFTGGGYINRNFPNTDPFFESNASNPTYEVYPSNGVTQQVMNFMGKTSGLNAYALTYLMASGKLFVQANYSTILFDADANVETDLPDMPNQIVRVYPASGANAMLPLTVANNYEQTILFCGGFLMPSDEAWGNYDSPAINPWELRASADCQRITPEPSDGSAPAYVQDDDLPSPRSMGQFILLPDGTILVVNGANNGTAGYGDHTQITPVGQNPYGESFATEPEGQPAIYNPNAPAGSRWSTAGLSASSIPRLYHSSAILLPDGSVMIAGSNPNIDTNLTTIYPTTYKAEYFYPLYFNAPTRPVPSGIPTTLSYGGPSFDITVPSSSYTGSANSAALNSTVWLSRPGWTTHGMNMGQRMLELNNTFTVQSDGSITLHVSQPPPNPNLFQPGPAYVWVTIAGVPSNGTYVVVGTGDFGQQPTAVAAALPPPTLSEGASGTGSGAAGANASNKPSGAARFGMAGSDSALIGVVTVGALLAFQLIISL